jgi:hypothetical protein
MEGGMGNVPAAREQGSAIRVRSAITAIADTILPWAGIPAAWAVRCRRPMPGVPRPGNYAVTACFWSLLVICMLRGLAASWTGMVRVSTPAA